MTRITGSHHVLGIEHLLGELWNGQGTVLLTATASERSKARHEEVKTWEGNHVDGKFAEISVELARESEAGGDTTHGGRDQMVQISVSGCGQLEGTEADI